VELVTVLVASVLVASVLVALVLVAGRRRKWDLCTVSSNQCCKFPLSHQRDNHHT